MSNTLILDNGAYSIKTGWSNEDSSSVRLIPNCVAKVKSERRRPFIGDQLEDVKDYSGLFYLLPAVKGYIGNWEVQKQVWNYIFKNKFSSEMNSSDKNVILSEPYFNFRSIQENLLEIFFEEYNFKNVALLSPAYLAAYGHCKGSKDKEDKTGKLDSKQDSAIRDISGDNSRSMSTYNCVIVDSGYSYTHIIPIINGQVIKCGIRRIDIGGKALTNHLKDIISYRQLHVLDETYVMNQCKEDSCYVSLNLDKDLEICKLPRSKNHIVRDYVLPDYSIIKRGHLKLSNVQNPIDSGDHSGNNQNILTDSHADSGDSINPGGQLQTIVMNNERIQIPELLFYPSDCNLDQIGISHSIFHSVENLSSQIKGQDKELDKCDIKSRLYKNIILIGGSTLFPGFRERIESDLRCLVDVIYDVHVYKSDNPILDPYLGAHTLANNQDDLKKKSFSKSQYLESGPNGIVEKMS